MLASCSGQSQFTIGPPAPPSSITTSSEAPDLSGIQLNPVAGKMATAPVAVRPGTANISGTVVGPDGPVAGAVVLIERLVDDAVGSIQVVSGADGTYTTDANAPVVNTLPPFTLAPSPSITLPGQLTVNQPTTTTARTVPRPKLKPGDPPGIIGGRYRVRAWRPPDLALTTPAILFVAAGQNQALPITLSRYTGTAVTSNIVPSPPIIGQLADVLVRVTSQLVDNQGYVRGSSVAGASVTIASSGGWTPVGPPTKISDVNGTADFKVVCTSLGDTGLSAIVGGNDTFGLATPACVEPPPLTTAPPSSVAGSTSTTHR